MAVMFRGVARDSFSFPALLRMLLFPPLYFPYVSSTMAHRIYTLGRMLGLGKSRNSLRN